MGYMDFLKLGIWFEWDFYLNKNIWKKKFNGKKCVFLVALVKEIERKAVSKSD